MVANCIILNKRHTRSKTGSGQQIVSVLQKVQSRQWSQETHHQLHCLRHHHCHCHQGQYLHFHCCCRSCCLLHWQHCHCHYHRYLQHRLGQHCLPTAYFELQSKGPSYFGTAHGIAHVCVLHKCCAQYGEARSCYCCREPDIVATHAMQCSAMPCRPRPQGYMRCILMDGRG